MSLTDELQRLAELRASGALTESEFQKAKGKLLEQDTTPYLPKPDDEPDQSLGRAANRYVTFQMVMAVIGILIFLFVIAPRMCSASRSPFGPSMPFLLR
jgi:hypothetical protein